MQLMKIWFFLPLALVLLQAMDDKPHYSAKVQSLLDAIGREDLPAIDRILKEHPEAGDFRSRKGASIVQVAVYNHKDRAAKELAKTVFVDFVSACVLGDEKKVRTMLDQKPSRANEMSMDGGLPLCLASAFGRSSVVKLLLDKGARVNDRSDAFDHVAPIHAAAFGRDIKCLKLLIDYGADVNATQDGSFTPLMEAANNGDLAIVKLLVSRGAKVDAKNDDGRTALDLAVSSKRTSVVRYLTAQLKKEKHEQ